MYVCRPTYGRTRDHTYVCVCVYVDVSVENIKNYFPSSSMQTGSVKLCYFLRYCFMCGTIHGACLRPKLMACFAYRCTLENVGTFWCVHLTHLHTCIFTGHIQNAWKKRRELVPHTKQGKNFMSVYVRKHVGCKVQPNNTLTHVRRTSIL
jgi:hypothetical protein